MYSFKYVVIVKYNIFYCQLTDKNTECGIEKKLQDVTTF